MQRVLWLWIVVACSGVSVESFAQDEEEASGAAEQAADEGDASGATEVAAEPEPEAKPAQAPAAASGSAPSWWVGPYIEGVLVPSFMLKLFLDATPSVFNPSFGATITHRNAEGFSWVLGLGYASYAFEGPFRLSGDPELDTEYVDSSLGLLHVRGMLLWSANISRTLAFEYGVGLEFGVVLGEMRRSEAYKDAGGEYHPCTAPLTPDPTYCELPTTLDGSSNAYDEEGAHYNVKEERVPPVALAVMIPALALRFTPMEKLAIKLEASYGIFQFTFGLSAAYALDG